MLSTIHIDAQAGNDTAFGGATSPIKNIREGLDRLACGRGPAMHVLQLSGSFEEIGNLTVAPTLPGENSTLLITGKSGEVDTISGPHPVTTLVNSKTLKSTGLGMVPDGYCGKWIRLDSASGQKQTRMIMEHDADSFQVSRRFLPAPKVGDTFTLLRPSARIKATSVASILALEGLGYGQIILQHLRLEGAQLSLWARNHVQLRSVILEGMNPLRGFWYREGGQLSTRAPLLNPLLGMVEDYSTYDSFYTGVSIRTPAQVENCKYAQLHDFCCDGIYIVQSGVNGIGAFRAKGAVVFRGVNDLAGIFGGNIGLTYQPTIENTAGIGLSIESSSVWMGSHLRVRNCGSHGIQTYNSKLKLTPDGVLGTKLSGDGNMGAGLNADTQSLISFPANAIPTITGSLGPITIGGLPGPSWDATAASDYSDCERMVRIGKY